MSCSHQLSRFPAYIFAGLGMFDHNWTVESIRPYVLKTIEVFGVDRCCFASNFPVDKLLSDYDRLYNAYKVQQ
jgi:predicted TIM-barrel fold metal-dependent hydrolase